MHNDCAQPVARPGELAALKQAFEQACEVVHRSHMAGLPIVNPALRVALVGLRAHDALAFGVLVTPWCMNLVALPRGAALPAARVGSVHQLSLPGGRVELRLSELPGFGRHLSGSLFSPMAAFTSQAHALAAAREALALLETVAPAPADTVPPGTNLPATASRRGFLLGRTVG